MTKYIASDLDGTLLKPRMKDNYVCDKNKNIVSRFSNSTILVSGRNAEFVENVCNELGIEKTYISLNGALIVYRGEKIFTYYLDNKIICEIIDFVKNRFKEYSIILLDDNNKFYSINDNNERVSLKEQNYTSQFPKLGYITIKDNNIITKLLNTKNSILKVNISLNDDDKYILYDYLVDLDLPLSYALCTHSLELTLKNVNKGNALKTLIQHMNISEKEIYVIGDDRNDVSMFNQFENSFLVSSETNESLKPLVKYVINSFDELDKYIKED